MKTKTKAMKANGSGMSAFQQKSLTKAQAAKVKGGNGTGQDSTTDQDWVGTEEDVLN